MLLTALPMNAFAFSVDPKVQVLHEGVAKSYSSLPSAVSAAAVVFGLGGFFIGKAAEKKKKPALADGTESKDEESYINFYGRGTKPLPYFITVLFI